MKQFLFAQAAGPVATTTTAAPAASEAGTVQPASDQKPQPPQQQQGGLGMFVPMLIIFALFYFLMIKPQQRKEKERRKMIQELRAGARVIFAGGLIGKIVEARERTFRIEIAGDVVIEVARSAVQGLASDDESAGQTK